MTNTPIELLLDQVSDPEQSSKAKTEILHRFWELKQRAQKAELALKEKSDDIEWRKRDVANQIALHSIKPSF